MRKLYPLLSVLLFLSIGLSQKEYDINHIVEQNGVYLKKFSDEFVSGEVFKMYGDMKVPLGKMKDGKKEGKWMVWYDNGTKQEEQNYIDGKKNGLFTEWNENQEIIQKGMFQSNLMNGEWFFLIKQSGFGFDNIVSTYDKGDGGNPDEFDDELNRDLFSEFDNYEFISGLMDIGIPINGLTKTIFNRDNDYLEINFKNGYFNGSTIQILNGQKKYEGTWKDGEKEGLETKWYENGQKESEGTYKNGEWDGLITNWYENGQKMYEKTFKDGKQDGLLIRWYKNGQKKEEGTYKDGKYDGLWTEWYENGQKSSETTYKDGKEDGLEIEWYENGQKSKEEKYSYNKDGKVDGFQTSWYENGNKFIEINYTDGKMIVWYENGQKKSEENYMVKYLIEDEFLEMNLHGLSTEWYKNGQKKSEKNYQDSIEDGLQIEWYKNGKKESIGYFKNGELHGTFKSYNEDGRVMGYREYLDGVPELFIFGEIYDGVEVITKWITTRTESLEILYEWKVNGIITEKQFQEKQEELFKKELYYGEQ